MAMGSGLLALAMLAADGPSCPSDEITFQVKVITLDGLEWRTSAYSRLQPVTRQGTSTIWTADRVLAMALAEKSKTSQVCGRMSTTGEGIWSKSNTVTYMAAMDRVADGPVNQATSIAFMPRPECIDERFAVKVNGRKMDQGVLATVAIEETHIDVMHQYSQKESIKSSMGKPSRSPAEVGIDVLNAVISPNPGDKSQSLACWVQIPEVSQARIAGEWLIPNDGVLLVSLGVKTVADDQGKAVVRERLAVIEANPPVISGLTTSAAVEVGQPLPIAVSSLGMPAIPVRSLPQPVDPNGVEVELPPLPEAVASANLDRIKPDQATPQAPRYAIPSPDSELARTSYTPFVPDVPASFEITRESTDARSELLERLLKALADAGVNVDLNPTNPSLKSVRYVCEKCNGDELFCPADTRDAKADAVAGGIKIAPDQPSAQIGFSVKDPSGTQVFDAVAPLTEALKTPGRTETKVIPLGENVSLEVKATVISTTPKVEARKNPVSSPKR